MTRSGHFYPLFKEASCRSFRVYRVLLQREVVSEARGVMIGLGWHPVGRFLRPHTDDGMPFAAVSGLSQGVLKGVVPRFGRSSPVSCLLPKQP